MKLKLWQLICGLTFLLSITKTTDAEQKIKETINYQFQSQANLKTVLYELQDDVNKKLVDLYPNLKQKIRRIPKKLNKQCYDQTIGEHDKVNIFKKKVRRIIEKFFQIHNHFIEKLSIDQIRQRVKVFIGNLAKLAVLLIQCMHQRAKGRPAVKLGLTSLAFYSQDEITNKILNHKLGSLPTRLSSSPADERCSLELRPEESLPPAFNWQDQGLVGPVMHQSGCGACYVIATTSAMVSQYMILNHRRLNNAVNYSIQATLDCMKNGCKGGSLLEPLRYYMDVGVTNLTKMNYTNKSGKCTSYPVNLKAANYCFHTNLEEEDMQLLVMRNGPSAVAIDAANEQMIYLKKKPFTVSCGKNLTHAVLLVGWTEKYWILQNSWGKDWGWHGYLHLPRGSNKCGIQGMLGIPLLAEE